MPAEQPLLSLPVLLREKAKVKTGFARLYPWPLLAQDASRASSVASTTLCPVHPHWMDQCDLFCAVKPLAHCAPELNLASADELLAGSSRPRHGSGPMLPPLTLLLAASISLPDPPASVERVHSCSIASCKLWLRQGGLYGLFPEGTHGLEDAFIAASGTLSARRGRFIARSSGIDDLRSSTRKPPRRTSARAIAPKELQP